MSNPVIRLLLRSLFAAAVIVSAQRAALRADAPVRERLSLDADWRFAREADGAGQGLAYDDLKPWILPARNAFLASAADRLGRPGADFPSVPAWAAPAFD